MTTFDDLPAGRELDALVAEKVMGLEVPDIKPVAIYVEGEWSIRFDCDHTDNWACYAEHAPVMVTHCNCSEPPDYGSFGKVAPNSAAYWQQEEARAIEEWKADRELCGHSRHCLEVVPFYSTDIAAAWEVVEKLIEYGTTNFELESGWFAAFVYEHNGRAHADTAPLAICRAALKAVGQQK